MIRGAAVALVALACSFAGSQTSPLTLQEALEQARKSSPMLRAARAEFQRAVAAERGARAMTGPQVSATGFATLGNKDSIVTSPPSTEPGAVMQVPSEQFAVGSVMVMMPVFAADVQAMASSSRWQAQAAAGEYREAEAELVFAVKQAYYLARSAHEDVATMEVTLAALQELLRVTKARFDSGKVVEAAVQRVQADVWGAERDLATARNNEAKALIDLVEVMGGDFGAPLTLADVGSEATPESLDGQVASALAHRGLMLAATARTKAAEAELRAAHALGLPRLYAIGMAEGTSRREMGGLTVGLALSFPLYDGGRVRSGVGQSKAMKERAEAELATAKLLVEKEVRQAFLDRQTATANLASSESAVQAAVSSYAVVAARVEAGKAILLEQLDALSLVRRSRSDLNKARLDLALAAARMKRAQGDDR